MWPRQSPLFALSQRHSTADRGGERHSIAGTTVRDVPVRRRVVQNPARRKEEVNGCY